jgi:hypothetical protein
MDPQYLTMKFELSKELLIHVCKLRQMRDLMFSIFMELKHFPTEHNFKHFGSFYDDIFYISEPKLPHYNTIIRLKTISELLLKEFTFLNIIKPHKYLNDFLPVVESFHEALFEIAKLMYQIRFYDSSFIGFIINQ